MSGKKSQLSDLFFELGLGFQYFSSYEKHEPHEHSHAFIEMLFVLDGKLLQGVGGAHHEESPSTMTLLNYEQSHSLQTPHGPAEVLNVYWDPMRYPAPSLSSDLTNRLHHLVPQHPCLANRLNQVLRFRLAHPSRVHRALRWMHEVEQERDEGFVEVLEALFKCLLVEICHSERLSLESHEAVGGHLEGSKAHALERAREQRRIDEGMEKVRLHLDLHHQRAVPLDELCELSKLKRANLCKQFKRYTGLSTGEYIKQKRLALAVKLLQTTEDKVMKICYDCGFSDLANFHRLFRQHFGCTPNAMRKRQHRD